MRLVRWKIVPFLACWGWLGIRAASALTPLPPDPPGTGQGLVWQGTDPAQQDLQGQLPEYVNQGPGARLKLAAPATLSGAEAIEFQGAAGSGTRLIELVSRRIGGDARESWSAGFLLPEITSGPLPTVAIPRGLFAPTPGTNARGPLPAEALEIDIRLARRHPITESGTHLSLNSESVRWVPQGWWPSGTTAASPLRISRSGRWTGDTPLPTGTWVDLELLVTTDNSAGNAKGATGRPVFAGESLANQGTPLGQGWLGVEGPDRDVLEHDDRVAVHQGKTRIRLWARKPGSQELHFLDPQTRRRATLVLNFTLAPHQYAVHLQPQGFLGRIWLTSNDGYPMDLQTTAPTGLPAIETVHVAVCDLSGRPLFARWFTPDEISSQNARIIVPAMGLHTVEVTATTAPVELVSLFPPEGSLLPEAIPAVDSTAPPPFALRAGSLPEGVTTRSHAGMLVLLENIPTTTPIVARDRFWMLINNRSASENGLYPFPLGIEGAGQVTDSTVERARAVAAAHRRLGSFWSSEEIDFAQAVPGPGIRFWTVPDRFWQVRRAEFTKVAIVLRGLVRWDEGRWPILSESGLHEWKGWIVELKRRFPNISMWVIGRDLDQSGWEPGGLWRNALPPEMAARLVQESADALVASGLPYRLGFGATDGFRPHYLQTLLSHLNPATTGLQAMVIRQRPIAPQLSPEVNLFPEAADHARSLLRERGLSARESWWLPVGFASHPAGLSPGGQSAAMGQTFAIGLTYRVSKMFWNRLADDATIHPDGLEARSGLLDLRLRPKPACAAFLINSFLLTRLDPLEVSTGQTVDSLHYQPTTHPLVAHHYRINQHSIKRAGGLTIAWTTGSPGDLTPPPASSSDFPPPNWPLEPDTPSGKHLYAYQSSTGGPVVAMTVHGTIVDPASAQRLTQTALGPTGRYFFPIDHRPLYIWDTGWNWGISAPQPR